MNLLLSKTYSIVTPEDAEIGEASETGFVFEDSPVALREAIRELELCSEASVWPLTPGTMRGTVWASYHEEDYCTGADTEYCIHLRAIDGRPLTGRNLYRIYRLAGLVKG